MEAGELLEVRKVWVTNMLLLGFDTTSCEDMFKVALEKDMFAHINKKGSEVVMHFLFTRLDSHVAQQEFRDCWPIFDKKQEAQFRKACSNWLAKIAKEEPSSRLPLLASSLLMSPGGDKFYLFLLRFSSYVLRKVCIREVKPEEKLIFLSGFVTSSDSHTLSLLKDMSAFAVKAHTVRHTQNVVKRTLLVSKLHREWEAYASELTEDYRSDSHEIKRLKKKLDSLREEKKQQLLTSTDSPGRMLHSSSSRASDKMLSLSAEVNAQKRQLRMEKVRSMWRSLEAFHDKTSTQKEVVTSILQGEANEHSIDANEIVFQVPELLLEEYEAVSREGKGVGNTYQAGKLNIVSLIQLWNCSLKVLKDKLSENKLPSFEDDNRYVNEALHTQRANVATARSLRASLSELQSSIDTSISELEERLHSLRSKSSFQSGGQPSASEAATSVTAVGHQQSAPVLHIPPVTVPSLGLDLLPPSPKKLLPASPDGSANKQLSDQPSIVTNLSFHRDEVSTPEAVHNISHSVHLASRQRPHQNHHQHHHQQFSASAKQHTSKLRAPQIKLGQSLGTSLLLPHTGDMSIFMDDGGSPSVPSTCISKTPATKSSTVSTPVRTTAIHDRSGRGHVVPGNDINTSDVSIRKKKKKKEQKPLEVKVIKSNTGPSFRDERTLSSKKPHPSHFSRSKSGALTSGYKRSPLTVHKVTAPVSSEEKRESSEQHEDKENATPLLVAMPKAHDILAEQIAAAVVDGDSLESSGFLAGTPEAQLHSFADPISAMGTDAFVSRDMIPRTPVSQPVKRTRGSANSTHEQESPSEPLLSSSQGRLHLTHAQAPSPLSSGPIIKMNLSSNTPPKEATVPASSQVLTPTASGHREEEPNPSSSLWQVSLTVSPKRENLEKSLERLSSSNKSPPIQQTPRGAVDTEEAVETPPTSRHTSANESYSPAGEVGGDESESEDEERTKEQLSAVVTDGKTGDTSSKASSRKVAFNNKEATSPIASQSGLLSPGSLNQVGLTFQTPPSSYHISSELPPTPFQYANFDLDSSASSEIERQENSQSLSQNKTTTSFDSSFGRSLQDKVEALISQEEVDLEGVVSRNSVSESDSQPKLVDIDLPKPSHHDTGHSLKVDDLLDLDSPSLSSGQKLQSPLQVNKNSPQVGTLMDGGTPGSSLAARLPLLTSTVQNHQSRPPLVTPISDNPLLRYLPSHSGTPSGLFYSTSIEVGKTWSSLENSGSPYLVSPPIATSSVTEKS